MTTHQPFITGQFTSTPDPLSLAQYLDTQQRLLVNFRKTIMLRPNQLPASAGFKQLQMPLTANFMASIVIKTE